jgi:uncharacterized repeat protein (TIGR04076 family)
MKKCKITVVKIAFFDDLAKQYASPALGECDMHKVGQEYYSNGWMKPDGLCDNAWKSMMEYVMTLSHGGHDFYNGGWMKDNKTAVVCCNDGIRPVSFKIEATNMDAEIF